MNDSATPQSQGTALAQELRLSARAALSELFGNFLRRSPAAFMAASKTMQTPAQQSSCLKIARSIASETEKWKEHYLSQIEAQMTGGLSQRLPGSDEGGVPMDELIAIANVELRAEAQYKQAFSDFEARLEHLRRDGHIPIHSKALSPAGLCRALSDAADLMEVPVKQRRVLFEKFNELFIADLKGFYPRLVEALSRPIAAPVKAAPAPPAADNADDLESTLPKVPRAQQKVTPIRPNMDDKTVSMLHSRAATADPDNYNDGSLAADLLNLTADKPPPGIPDDKTWVPLQRMKLAGDFLNDAVADPFVPKELGAQNETVRFPLIKSALTDSTLFTAVTHPLRSLVNELMLKAATSRVTGSAETKRIAELLQQVLVQFDLAPDFVREAMLTAQPIPETQMQRFFEMQKQQAAERKAAVITQAKRAVLQELEQSTFGRDIPDPALKFLNAAWGPLLVKRLLLNGIEHPLYSEGLELMNLLLDQLEDREPVEAADIAWQELTQKMAAKLSSDGMPVDRVTDSLSRLEAARTTPRA